VTETEIISYVGGQSGVVTLTASEENSAPEAAWGDTFCYYDPEGNRPENQRLPFATIVTHDYAGWDTESHLDRQGIFRVNIAVGRSGFEQLLGYRPPSMKPITTTSIMGRPTSLSRIRSTPHRAGSRSSIPASGRARSLSSFSTMLIAWRSRGT